MSTWDDRDHEQDDPARGFLDQTVPRDDAWEGREPEEGPARPRHVQYPTEPEEPLTAKERRKEAIKNAAWRFGPSAAFLAGAGLVGGDDSGGGDDGGGQGRFVQANRPEPADDPGFSDYPDYPDYSGGYGDGGM